MQKGQYEFILVARMWRISETVLVIMWRLSGMFCRERV